MTTKKIIIVLGMHRSGTSALTRGLDTMGVALGDNLHPAGIDNPTGFWEDSDVIAINNELLHQLGSAYDRVGLIDAQFEQNESLDALSEKAKALLKEKLFQFDTWGMKDPRLPRLLPFWQRLIKDMGAEVAYVIALRNPLNVADSLARRNGFPEVKSYLLWLEHMLQAVMYTKGEKRVVVAYDRLLTNAAHELGRIAYSLDLPFPEEPKVTAYTEEFLDASLRHGSRSESELYNGNIEPHVLADTYALLSDCAHDRLSINSAAFEQRLLPKIGILRRFASTSSLIASAERESAEAANSVQQLNVSLYSLGEQLKAVQKALHESNLENIALNAKVATLVDLHSQPDFGKDVQSAAMVAEMKGLEALVTSLRFEAERAAQSYQELLALKDQELVSLRILPAVSASLPGGGQEISKARLESLEAEVNDSRLELAELTARHQALHVKLVASTAAEELGRHQLSNVQAALQEAYAALDAMRQESLSSELLTQQKLEIQAKALHEHEYIQTRLFEQVGILSQAWGALLNSRSWKLFRLISGKKKLPLIVFRNGSSFDDDFYLERYPDVKSGGYEARAHYLSHGIAEGREGYRVDPASVVSSDMLANTPVIVESVPIEMPGTDMTNADVSIEILGGDASPQAASQAASILDPFNAAFYLAIYPDIAMAGIDPEKHYRDHGKAEGRLGTVPEIPVRGMSTVSGSNKPKILMVSHEASRTGAPILSLNIVQRLAERFEVTVMIFGGGPLVQAFLDAGALVAGPVALKHRPVEAQWVLNRFLDQYSFEFAIVNSLESYVALKPLADRFIPTVSLIHEFAVYTRPRTAIQNALLWASETVFSADVTLASAVKVLPEINACQLPVLSQGKSIVPGEPEDEERLEAEKRNLERLMRPDGKDDGTVVILGAGWVQIRKGVDLFIECATRVLKSPIGAKCRFVWIGNNYDPEHDTLYSVYLHDQIQRAGIEERFAIISETAAIEHVYKLSDMLLLTSRLDPLPNVAIDAMVQGLPVLCFDQTTGIADILKRNDLEADCVAPYLDTGHMATLLTKLAASRSELIRVGKQAQATATREFDMEAYVDKLVAFADTGTHSSNREQADCLIIEQANVLDLDYYAPGAISFDSIPDAVRRYVRSWSRGVLRRKPFAGFDPALYKELNPSVLDQDPLAHFLEAGRPAGVWCIQPIVWESEAHVPDSTETLLFVSVQSYMTLVKLLDVIEAQSTRIELILMVPDELSALEIRRMLADELRAPMRTIVCGDQPLSTMFRYLANHQRLKYVAIGHLNLIHVPTAIDFSSTDIYHNYLIENLIGGRHSSWHTIVNALIKGSDMGGAGLIYPDDPNVHTYLEDRSILEKLCEFLGYAMPSSDCIQFPVNGNFWLTPLILRTVLAREEELASKFKVWSLNNGQQERLLSSMLVHAAFSNGRTVTTTVVAGITY